MQSDRSWVQTVWASQSTFAMLVHVCAAVQNNWVSCNIDRRAQWLKKMLFCARHFIGLMTLSRGQKIKKPTITGHVFELLYNERIKDETSALLYQGSVSKNTCIKHQTASKQLLHFHHVHRWLPLLGWSPNTAVNLSLMRVYTYVNLAELFLLKIFHIFWWVRLAGSTTPKWKISAFKIYLR